MTTAGILAQAGASPGWGWVTNNLDDIWERTVEHLQLTFVAVGVGFVVSLLLAVAAHRRHRLRAPIMNTASVLFTIPSIALFPLLVPFTGIGVLTAEIGLVLYSLLVLVRNIVAGLDGVPAEVREAAVGMGYTARRLLLEIELPLALPVVIAGLRIATVTTVGLVTVTALLGLGGLGFFILDGFQSNMFVPKMVVGAVGSMVLAFVLEGALLIVERVVTPWSRRAGAV